MAAVPDASLIDVLQHGPRAGDRLPGTWAARSSIRARRAASRRCWRADGGAAGAAAHPHPPRPRGRDRRARRAVPGPRGLGARARRAAPRRPHEAAAERRADLRRRDGAGCGAGSCPVPERNLRVLEGGETIAVGGRDFDVEYTPGHASHHVVYFDRSDGTAYVGDVAGVRIPPADYVRAPTPPPDIDVEAWQRSIDLRRRAPAGAPRADPLRHGGRSRARTSSG